ncbi:MAG: 50S ribosomal protein L31 [Chloroflexi bacterium]|nr:50S ribosomal protein L31 [Chloroflexota bacterium]
MREGIHPTWYSDCVVVCACGNTWTTGATQPELRTDVCSACHPFYTGEQRIVDTEGQVDRFMRRLRMRDQMQAEADQRAEEKTPLDLPVTELELGTRNEKLLAEAGLETAGDLIDKLASEGDEGLLGIRGFGQKGLIDVKRRLRMRGFEVPGDADNDEDDSE